MKRNNVARNPGEDAISEVSRGEPAYWGLIFLVGLATACAAAPVSTPASVSDLWHPFQAGLPTRTTVMALAVSPDEPHTLFAGAYDTTGAYVSTDQGRSWQPSNAGLDHASVFALRYIGNALFAGTTAGLFRWRGDDWERVAAVPAISVYSIGRGAEGGWYAAADTQGVFKSVDDGNTWTHLPGLDGELVASVASVGSSQAQAGSVPGRSAPGSPASAQSASTILVGTSGDGAFVSHDGGVSWHALDIFRGQYVSLLQVDPRDGQTLYLRTRGGLFRSRDDGASWQLVVGGIENEAVNALLFDTASPRLYAATDSHGVYVSEDEGATWSRAGAGLPTGTPMYALAKVDAKTIVAGGQTGIYVSRDAGKTWMRSSAGLGAPQIHAVELDPRSGTLLAATEDGLYRAGMDGEFAQIEGATQSQPVLSVAIAPTNPQVIYVGTYRHGVFVSRDGGATWSSAGDIFHDRLIVPGVTVDPRDDRTVIARVLFERMYKSLDGGALWHAVWTGMPVEAQVGVMSYSPIDPTQMFAGTNIGLFSSSDSGESWTRRGLAQQTVFALWLDPANLRQLLAGATDGLYRSDDGGTTWTRIALSNVTVTAIARDPNGDWCVGTKYNGAWTSRDGGKTWMPFGLQAESISALVIDPTRGTLYAVTELGLFKYSLP